MVLKCEIGIGGREASVEEYGLDALAATAEAVVAGLGPLAVQLAELAVEAGRAVTLDAMEGLVTGQGGSCCAGWSSWPWMARLMPRSGWRR